MDITPIYELQTRLRSAAIAGVRLLQEDFRLKRAAEALKALEGASPVFAKLNQQMALLLSADCQNPAMVLLDTIALTDAVVCTLGAVEVKGEIEELDTNPSSGEIVVNAPYSQVKGLIEALTASGSGNYALVRDTHQANPEIFKDYRVRHAMIQALGASYAELADMVKDWLKEEDDSIIPLLKKDFDPKGKKDMLRRLEVIAAISGEKENDFYIQMLECAEKDIRLELIKLLGFNPVNVDLLLDMVNTEKGSSKKMVLHSLANIADDRVYAVFEKMAKKKPEEVCEYLVASTTQGASQIISQMCLNLLPEVLKIQNTLPKALKMKDNQQSDEERLTIERFSRSVEALVGKSGDAVLECYRQLLTYQERLEKLAGGSLEYRVNTSLHGGYDKPYSWEGLIGNQLALSLAVHEDEQLGAFAMEQYDNHGGKEKNARFLSAATLVKLFEGEDCTAWLDEQIKEKGLLKSGINKERFLAVGQALEYICWNKKKEEHIVHGYINELKKENYRVQSAGHRFFERVRHMPNYNAVMEWMKKYYMDETIYAWANKSDKDECARTGEWFYNRFLDTGNPKKASSYHSYCMKHPNYSGKYKNHFYQRAYLKYMKDCGWTKCEGLAQVFAETNAPFDHTYMIYTFFENLPGNREAVRAELDAFIDLAKQNKIGGISDISGKERIDVSSLERIRDERF
ncbi:MAG: hypothetical protein J6C19_02625 [Lachnospiraceae bacterium]|nr:hypothetical protein [Lachnospiraceae bacterium]